ncbi:MAG: maltose alpha-D-glucosyltransferase [Dehalococcoidia bacterium]
MARGRPRPATDSDPLWFKDAVIYEVHVRAFHDSNADGIGDFGGLREKLPYLQDLGVTTLWLQPFFVSPLKDDGYDIEDYRTVNPDYGTLRDFQEFLDEAHARGLRVITELVVNHTSDQHAWFQRARRAPKGSPLRDYYVWSDTPDKYKEVRIIFRDFEHSNWAWDPVAEQYYWHRFYSHQPDLNFESPRVKDEIFALVDYWFGMGIDGFRLDAIPYLYEEDGTSSENLPRTHEFLKELRAYVDRKYPGRLLLAEANQWPDDVAVYFGDGDECHMAYHFPLMPRLYMAARMEDRFPITEILEQTPAIPDNCQWAIFLRNHDELTLEMVSDEERDYMYRVYAADQRARINLGIRRRLAPLLGYNRRLMELMNALLFSMQGTPVLYYGDEIAMGDNIYLGDRNGVRTPMQWSAERNAGFSKANPQKLFLPAVIDPEAHFEAVNVESQQANPSTFLWWMKRLIALRKQHKAFGRGTMQFVEASNRKVLAYTRSYEDDTVLVVANLSRYVQPVELNLAAFAGTAPVEMIGRNAFPGIGEAPYFLSLGPHAFFWFQLEAPSVALTAEPAPQLTYNGRTWSSLFEGRSRAGLEAVLRAYVPARRWFGSKARRIRQLAIQSVIPVSPRESQGAVYTTIEVEYYEGERELYVLPLTVVSGADAEQVSRDTPWAVVGPISGAGLAADALLVDASVTQGFAQAILQAFRRRSVLEGDRARLAFKTPFRLPRTPADAPVVVARGEQSNTTLFYGTDYALKLFRRLEAGTHPQVEIQTFLAEEGSVSHVPRLAGTASITLGGREIVAGVLEQYIPSECDAWTYVVDELRHDFETLAAQRPEPPARPETARWTELARLEPPAELLSWAARDLELAEILGRRAGELHRALSNSDGNPDFEPEAFTPFYQQSLGQGLQTQVRRTLRAVRDAMPSLPEAAKGLADEVLSRQQDIVAHVGDIARWRLEGKRMRHHGDFHLGQVLFTGRDFVIIDFEGEPARSLSERRIKRSPFRDVAGMVRSYNYAAHFVLQSLGGGGLSEQDAEWLRPWADAWFTWTAAAFLRGYFAGADGSAFLPPTDDERERMLSLLLLEKALYEVNYELQNRPAWINVPLEGILDCIGREV